MRKALFFLLGFAACTPAASASSIGTGHFVSDDAIAAVKVCETRADEVLASFGEPTSRGRDDDFTTYQWLEVAAAREATGAVVGSQVIQVWVDPSGRVARIVVNPTTMPERPTACATRATKAASKTDAPGGSAKAKSR